MCIHIYTCITITCCYMLNFPKPFPLFNDFCPRHENLVQANKTLDVYLSERLLKEDWMIYFFMHQKSIGTHPTWKDDALEFYNWIDTEFPPEPSVSGS